MGSEMCIRDRRDPFALEPVQPVPQEVAGLRVEPGGRLVEQQQLGVVDQGPGDGEPPLHAAGERLDRLVVYAGDGEHVHAQVLEAGLRPLSALVRRSTLEDVFLRLTGRSLHE